VLDGEPLRDLTDVELALLRRRRLGFVLQFFNLFPTMSAIENVALPLSLDHAPRARDRAHAALEAVGLGHRVDHRPSQMSGGEQQRTALARALVTEPAIVLADEPTGNLDTETGRQILELLRQTASDGQTIVMVTHDPKVAAYADRVLQLADGRLVERE
jgi:putative ABC transport system ATP-binding protein